MEDTRYLLVIQHNGGIFKKPYGEEGSKYVFTSPDECDKNWQNIFIEVGAKAEDIEKRIKQRECLNMEAFGEDTPLSQNLPIFKISVTDMLLRITALDDKRAVVIKDPDHLAAVYIANRNWHYCLQHTEEVVKLFYILEREPVSEKTDLFYSLCTFDCPRALTNMAKDIKTVLRIYDRYLNLRHIQHMAFVGK